MAFFPVDDQALLLSMQDVNEPLSAYSRHGFTLDGADWPSVEHYFQGLRFEDLALRERIRAAPHPADAHKLGQRFRRRSRSGWNALQRVYMTRALFTKVQAHETVYAALAATGQRMLVERSQYDYFWGCGRDTRGLNHYGRILMDIRARVCADKPVPRR